MGKDWYDGCMLDQEWRLNHLYYITTKNDGVQRFKMNWAQEQLFKNLHTRNTILKARQLGMSTFISILILDRCLHEEGFEAGIIDRTETDAHKKLKKIKLAYNFLANPPETTKDHVEDEQDRKNIRKWCQIIHSKVTAVIGEEKAVFSSAGTIDRRIDTGTTMRGDTLKFLHVSEYGYVAHNFPQRAQEIKTGAMESVPAGCVVVIESTHEGGKTGENYRIMKSAMENEGKELDEIDYRFFFFSWWKQAEYRIRSNTPLGSTELDSYFSDLAKNGIELDEEQKRWYYKKYKILGDSIKQEYPSTPEEAIASRIEGSIYGSIISRLRAAGLVGREFETDDYAPLYVSWDIGMSDNTSMWLIQVGVGGKFHVLDYYTSTGRALPHYIDKLRSWEREHGQSIKMNLLPHDANQRNMQTGLTYQQFLYKAKFQAYICQRVGNVWNGIAATRTLLNHCVFHKRCSEQVWDDELQEYHASGVDCLEFYQTTPDGANGIIKPTPLHNQYSHGADAFRIFAEAHSAGIVNKHARDTRETKSDNEFAVRQNNKRKGLCKGIPFSWA